MTITLSSTDALVADIPDGAVVAAMKDTSGAPMALARALIRRGMRNRAVRGLHLVSMPTGGLFADVLIGAGCVAVAEGGGVTLGEYGQAPNFVRAVKLGAVRPLDTTCPAVYAALQAGEKGIPFMPLRGLIGSDILTYRSDYKILENPIAADAGRNAADPIVLIPAIRPDVALIHAPLADRDGNLWIGREHELRILAHAAKRTVATVEQIYEGDFTADPMRAAGVIPALYVDAIALAPAGALPRGMPGFYEEDAAAITAYVRAAETAEGFHAWLDRFLADGEGARRAAE